MGERGGEGGEGAGGDHVRVGEVDDGRGDGGPGAGAGSGICVVGGGGEGRVGAEVFGGFDGGGDFVDRAGHWVVRLVLAFRIRGQWG